ncbi:MAG: hypothetical protein HZA50_11535 [Planctomycetes bacterium]|nr:hypothetical protein [Planctomycetota bacterium]
MPDPLSRILDPIRYHAERFSLLNSKPRLQAGKVRRIHAARSDAISDLLALCRDASQIAAVACTFGVSKKEILTKARRASSFGQFRMVIGNRMRGVAHRIAAARKKGIMISAAQAARKR